MPSDNQGKRDCPSAPLHWEGASVIGVVGGSADLPIVGYLNKPLRVQEAMAYLPAGVHPGEVFRIGARCQEDGCFHFKSNACTLGQRIVKNLPEVVASLPPCILRATCRWWAEQGKDACKRCPQVVTHLTKATATQVLVARPPGTDSG